MSEQSQQQQARSSRKAGQDVLQILKQNETLSASQVEQAERRSERAGVEKHQAVLDLGLASQEAVYRAVAAANGLDFVVLQNEEIPEEAKNKVSAKVAFHYQFVPLSVERGILRAAFANPPSMRERENLRLLLGTRLKPVIATPAEIHRTLKSVFGLGAETVLQIRQDRSGDDTTNAVQYEGTQGQDLADMAGEDENASIVQLVNQILVEALGLGATDIHIEPYPETAKVRYRIDGMLRDIPTPQGLRELHEAIVSRFKVMADMDIAEKRLPQDGRIRVKIKEDEFDLRVSILPTRFGETMCLRILNRGAINMELSELGMNQDQLNVLTGLVDLPHGILLVTGPTGSGKTTTLYAALNRVMRVNPERKIITVEDPVEYELQGTSQIQIQADIGLTFASGLRSILRHDPDVVLVGEIRDQETAEIAIRASLTGHLVLSTLHTNDSVSAVTRLVDMGVEGYLVASSLVAAMAQRLVRRICPHCKAKDNDISERAAEEIAESLNMNREDIQAWKGKGCLECDHTGYSGRVAILEIFLLDEEIQEKVAQGATTRELRIEGKNRGMRNLRDAGWEKVLQGLTSIEEVERITGMYRISYESLTENQ